MPCSSPPSRPGHRRRAGPCGMYGGWTVPLARAIQTRALAVGLSVLCCLSGEAAAGSAPSLPDNQAVEFLSHDLSLDLIPDQHRIKATDRLTLKVLAPSLDQVSVILNAGLSVTAARRQVGTQSQPLSFVTEPGQVREAGGREAGRRVTVQVNGEVPSGQVLVLDLSYEGTINDPPRESRQLRFVTPSETSGHIGSEGVYLSGETRWYPDQAGSLATFRVTVTTPQGWQAVTHGREVRRAGKAQATTTEWEVSAKTEALTLVANRFTVNRRNWLDATGRPIEVVTYLFPEEAPLAEDYLDASVRYLEAYAKLLGPYPFPKFAVVENFFASGLGMPSFTLLGSGVVKRRYTQPYALGHEIVHSWFGNWVLNDVEAGNWVEGLTTYLANYYHDELAGKAEQAREQRRMMVLGYAVYVRPEDDYPVGRFRQKVDQKDNAIGYQKAAMVFHMLRREVGEEIFWGGLKKLVADYGGRYGTWREVERVFSDMAGRDLRWFFAQWVERTGAPSLTVREAVTQGEASSSGGYSLKVRIAQTGDPYRLSLPVSVKLAGGRTVEALATIDSAEQEIVLDVPSKPISVAIDPAFHSFRRLSREQVPPMLNLFVTGRQRSVVLPSEGPEASLAPYVELAGHMTSREPDVAKFSDHADHEAVLPGGSVLVLGGPGQNRLAGAVAQVCGKGVRLEPDRFTVGGTTYDGAGSALLLSCRRADRTGDVVTLFYGLTPQAAATVARLLFFYGWQSYLVFHEGAVVARGDFSPSRDEGEVAVDAQ
ncbi:MAG: hypothetical protein FJ246_01870 [Nitrospira sp.]|nr:hypothetical protein [Nitrospira sp.]